VLHESAEEGRNDKNTQIEKGVIVMTVVSVETYVVAKPTFVEHEKFINEVYLPTWKKLDKRLKSLNYFSCWAAQGVSSFGGRMIISEYDSLADMEKSDEESQSSEERRNLTTRFCELIDNSSHRASLWTAGSLMFYQYMK
jgi:hypothetical protein